MCEKARIMFVYSNLYCTFVSLKLKNYNKLTKFFKKKLTDD